jgi:hypothetical protein
MPSIKSPVKKSAIATKPETETIKPVDSTISVRPKLTIRNLVILLILAGVVLVWLFFRSKPGLFMAATVNGKPILKSELNKRLSDRFGEQMLEALISEQLIIDEAQKRGIVVSNDDIQNKIKEIEESLKGSMSLDESLKMQGISRGEFEKQIAIQLMIDKMFSGSASVSGEQVDQFIKDQKDSLTATTPAEQKIEAEAQIRNNQISDLFIEWFNKAKSEASVSKYLNPN